LIQAGTDPEQAKDIAVAHVTQKIKYVFQQMPYQGPSFFSVTSQGGTIIINLNAQHPASTHLVDLLQEVETEGESQPLYALKLMLCAWARLEDETMNETQRQRYIDLRDEWGRMARRFLTSAFGD
jgi:hypothetical protein